jgi:hypothetical protein
VIDLERFKHYVRNRLECEPVIEQLAKLIGPGGECEKQNREEIFTKRFLCPRIKDFFHREVQRELGLTDEQIQNGLGAEGFEGMNGFRFTPASSRKHLFTKAYVIKPTPPPSWFKSKEVPLTECRACPDFAIRSPLPFSLVGEVKFFKSGSPNKAVSDLYQASRQALFYQAAFHEIYHSALIVFADASPGHSFFEGLELIKPELLERFSSETDIHLLPIKLT